jgi:hypothetical protein
MSTQPVEEATPQSSSSRRASPNRARSESRNTQTFEHSLGLVVTEVSHDTAEGLRTLVPNALLRPTTAVDFVFAVVEQLVMVGRRTTYEVASIVEAAIEGAERRAAA